jgi:hypothetical protein
MIVDVLADSCGHILRHCMALYAHTVTRRHMILQLPQPPPFLYSFLSNIEDAMSHAGKPSLKKANVDVAPDDNIDFRQEEPN